MVLIRYAQRVTAKAAGATAVALAAAALSGVLGTAAVAQTSPSAVNVADARSNEIQQLVATLNDPNADARTRDEAARRLASRNSADAKQQLLAALNNAGNPRSQLAVARALAGQVVTPDPAFIDPLFAVMGPDRALSEAAGQALASYKLQPAVADRLLELAKNAQVHQNVRTAAIGALGSFPEKRVARTLVDLTGETSGSIRNAAGDALVAMTGLTENGRDSARWRRWWSSQSAKSDAVFRDDLLMAQSARLDDATARIQQMADEMQAILTDVYRATSDAAGKDALLIKWINSGEPQVRLIAARFIVEDFQNGRRMGQPVIEGLRTLVGDSSPAVRLQATRTIGTLTDIASFNVLLSQLSQEPLPEVRAAIVTTLGSWEDPRAVPEISKLLDDESLTVVEASAEALTRLGPKLRAVEPVAAQELSKKLRQTFEDRGSAPGAERLREALVEAMAPLKDQDSLLLFMGLLKPRETDRMRRAALQGIAALENPNAADRVRAWLESELNPEVKKEALTALGASSRTEFLGTFFEYMNSDREPADVREHAWSVFKSRLPYADVAQLSNWANKFQQRPERRVEVLKVLADKFAAAKNMNDLALTRQNLGETLTRIPGDEEQMVANAADAAVLFKQALDYHREAGAQPNVTEKLVNQYLDALLAARKYAEAGKFAGEQMEMDTSQIMLAGRFRVEAERLRDQKKYSLALSLIEEALKIKALNLSDASKHYLAQLKEVEAEVNTLSRKSGEKNGTSVPVSNEFST